MTDVGRKESCASSGMPRCDVVSPSPEVCFLVIRARPTPAATDAWRNPGWVPWPTSKPASHTATTSPVLPNVDSRKSQAPARRAPTTQSPWHALICATFHNSEPPRLVHKGPQERPALLVQQFRTLQVVQIPGEVADQQPTMRQGARPIIEPRLERARTLLRLDSPAANLDFLVDFQHARHLEHEPRDRERQLQRRA